MPELGFRDPNNVCGSIRGYDRHCYHHERPCAACNRAKAVTKTLSGVRSDRRNWLLRPRKCCGPAPSKPPSSPWNSPRKRTPRRTRHEPKLA